MEKRPQVGIGIIVVNAEGKILVHKRKGNHAPFYSIFGGHVKIGESFEQAAIREAQEEKRTASRTEWKTERPATHTPSVRQRRNQTWGLPTASHRDQNSDIARPPWGILASEK